MKIYHLLTAYKKPYGRVQILISTTYCWDETYWSFWWVQYFFLAVLPGIFPFKNIQQVLFATIANAHSITQIMYHKGCFLAKFWGCWSQPSLPGRKCVNKKPPRHKFLHKTNNYLNFSWNMNRKTQMNQVNKVTTSNCLATHSILKNVLFYKLFQGHWLSVEIAKKADGFVVKWRDLWERSTWTE